ncbi:MULTISPECIES: Rz1-like lysis system protein LysC [Bilophila]|uniref:Rz1-like lysis system protein LysC n=1 Tax=Bilophila TaxID=35832 RepID=UPI00068001EC|nr:MULTISPECIES: Rz1-like lysis system protein LysC [Bilophila]MDR3813360.1 Rz1-like lysis system protein LysC [Bilophila sp.]MDR4026484.1 Rz1-like lysis system protein LysC [Bilophila sp.]
MTGRLAIGAALCCLLPLTGCSGKPVATMPVVIRQDAPAYLTAETPVPLWTGVNNADLVDYVLSLRQALGSCNADKAAIRGGR